MLPNQLPHTGNTFVVAGGLVVIIEAKVELRDSAGWDTLDRAITRLGGVASAAVEAGASAAAAAAVATVSGADAAGVMSPGDSEDDDVAGQPCLLAVVPVHMLWLQCRAMCLWLRLGPNEGVREQRSSISAQQGWWPWLEWHSLEHCHVSCCVEQPLA